MIYWWKNVEGKSKIKYDFVIQDPLLPDILSSATKHLLLRTKHSQLSRIIFTSNFYACSDNDYSGVISSFTSGRLPWKVFRLLHIRSKKFCSIHRGKMRLTLLCRSRFSRNQETLSGTNTLFLLKKRAVCNCKWNNIRVALLIKIEILQGNLVGSKSLKTLQKFSNNLGAT